MEWDRITHTATASEILTELPVNQGTFVKKGTVLAKLDERQQSILVTRAEADVTRTKANLEKLRNGAREEEVASAQATVEGARATLLEAQQSYDRNKNLREKRMVGQADLDHALAKRDAAEANLTSAQEQLRVLTNGTREEDLRMAEAELTAAKAQRDLERKRLSDLTIVATRDGVLDNLPWNIGERVTVNSPVAILLADEAPFAQIYVPEPFRARIHIGNQLTVHIDGVDMPVAGQVRWISSEPAFTPYYALNQSERSRLVYLAEITLPATSSDLPAGIPVQVVMPQE